MTRNALPDVASLRKHQVSRPFPSLMDLQLQAGNTWPGPHLSHAHPLVPSRGLVVQQGLSRSLDCHRLVPTAPISALRAVSVPAVSAAGGRGTGTKGQREDLGLLSSHAHPTTPALPTSQVPPTLPPPPVSPPLLAHLCLRELREWPDL